MIRLLPALPLVLLLVAPAFAADKLYVYSSVGDNQWVSDWPPIDGPATVAAMFEGWQKTYGVSRVYWRGEQDRMWLDCAAFRPENPLYYDWWTNWMGYLSRRVNTDALALKAAHQRGMQIYIFTALFDYGARGDVGGCGAFPYATEDRLLIEHPEWRPVDRWGERTAPGPPEFCYPELRKILVDRHVKYVAGPGYDGLSFYTYVENMGQRYMDEFGFNEPIVREFQRRYGVDIRREPFDRAAWNKLRGEYVTQFLAELHTALKAKGKKLSVVMRPDQPNLPQRWLCLKDETLPTGGITMDWEGWIRQGVVDELFIWCGGPNAALTQQVLDAAKGTGVEVVVLSSSPFHESWKPFRAQGVTPCTVGAPGYGIDPITLEPTSPETLHSADWRLRVQTLTDIAADKIKVESTLVARLLDDPHVLVRREALRTLAKLQATDEVPAIEHALRDQESSVRIAAATALGTVHGPESAERLLAELERDGGFQYKQACLASLTVLKDAAIPALKRHQHSRQWWVRETIVRALTPSEHPDARDMLLAGMADQDYRVRAWAVLGVKRFGDERCLTALLQALADKTPTVQLRAATALGERASALPAPVADQAFAALSKLFEAYGEGSKRTDASWGWRVVGMALQRLGDRGQQALEQWRIRREDKWLAWSAYEVLHVPQDPNGPIIVSEADAVASHDKYAPPFPGHRR